MLCANCGHNNSSSARFCANCGAMLIAPRASLQPGQTMNNGQYRIVRPLGKGGMGAIYLAQNTQAFDRPCVIKEMIAYYEPGQEQKARERFELEARTLAELKHPGIPDMYGFFSEQGHNYIVMEYIEGENLEQALDRVARTGEALQVDELVRYGVEICRVLEYLAQVKPEPIVHCDIKPANIIIDRNANQAVLVDFGTAKARYLRSLQTQPDARRASVYGTVGYAPPELYKGLVVSKSDIFSLAATLYHLLSGDDPREHPFQWPAMSRVPAPLALILQRGLANEVDQRLDATQFRVQLEAYRAAQAGTIRPLTFPDGNQATTLTGVLDLAQRYWAYSKQILYDGSLDAWLRQVLHDPVAANRAAEAVREHPHDPDVGLDIFIRGLNPRMPPPRLYLSESEFDLGNVAPGAAVSVAVTLNNGGPGGSRGTIQSLVPWLRPSVRSFAVPPGGALEIDCQVVDSDRLSLYSPQSGVIRIQAVTGQTLDAIVRLRVSRVGAQAGPVRPSAAPLPSTATLRRSSSRSTPPMVSAPPRKRRRWGLILLILAILVGGALLLTYRGNPSLPEASVQRGIEALQEGNWEAAARNLAKLDPHDPNHVHDVALMLDDMLVEIPGGTLHMGRADGSLDERPEHDVQIAPFALDRFEVTNVQYQAFIYATGHPAPPGWVDGYFPDGKALYPVTNVSWEDAQAYAAWAGKRLPTEAEWEWAARGANGRLFPWGNLSERKIANSATYGASGTLPVGSYPTGATPEGIYDMAGNVREWTADRYTADYSAPSSLAAAGDDVAVRGSSWHTYNDVASAREKVASSEQANDLGFRCAR